MDVREWPLLSAVTEFLNSFQERAETSLLWGVVRHCRAIERNITVIGGCVTLQSNRKTEHHCARELC